MIRLFLFLIFLLFPLGLRSTSLGAEAPEVPRGLIKLLGSDFQDGTLEGLEATDDSLILGPSNSGFQAQGTYTSPVLSLAFEAIHLGLHWSARIPAGTAVQLSVRARPLEAAWSPWQAVEGRLGSENPETPDKKKALYLALYPLIFSSGVAEVQVRIILFAQETGITPWVKEIHLYYSDPRLFLDWVETQRQRRGLGGSSKKSPLRQ